MFSQWWLLLVNSIIIAKTKKIFFQAMVMLNQPIKKSLKIWLIYFNSFIEGLYFIINIHYIEV
jgi:hypothetical protein